MGGRGFVCLPKMSGTGEDVDVAIPRLNPAKGSGFTDAGGLVSLTLNIPADLEAIASAARGEPKPVGSGGAVNPPKLKPGCCF